MKDFKPFSFEVNIETEKEALAWMAVMSSIGGHEDETMRKIFCHEQDPCVRRVIEGNLESMGYEFESAESDEFNEMDEMTSGTITFKV
jgi:hypothetical protein